ncbi:retrovirus-related pol polyprotein from transposon TNT 1-94 [Tanacetum coccineum]
MYIQSILFDSSYTPPVIMEVPSELPKVSLVNASLKKLKFHLTQFDYVVKKRTTPNALEEGEWGFEHTKTIFNNEIIPFVKSLKDICNVFDKDLLNEITEVQTVFDQMETAVKQFSVNKQCLEIAEKETLLEIDRLLHKIMSQEVMLNVMNFTFLNNDIVNMKMQKCDSCEKCLNLDAELTKSKQDYNALLKNHSQIKKHCISLEVSMQSKQEVFQNDNSCVNHNAVEIQEYFEINDLKAQLQDKDTICKLKDTIRSLSKNAKEENVNHDCDLEPINEELENSVATLLSENEHLWKEIVENATQIPSATTIAPSMFKLDLVPLPPRLFQNREAHIDFIKHTQENANILREIVELAKAKQPLDSELDFTCKYATRIQELLVYVQDTCPNAITHSSKKIAVTPMNNVKKVRFAEPITSSSKTQQVESSKTSDSNTPVLSSTGVKCSTSNCGSKPRGNKKNDRISQPPKKGYPSSSSLMTGTVRFGNDQIARIMGYVVFWKNACFIRNLEGVDLLSGSHDTNLYTISLDDMLQSSPICLLSKASNIKSWLWHRRLSHLNFDTLNKLAKDALARGIPRLKFQKDHLCSACALGKTRTPQQNSVVERHNRTLVEVARTMLIFSKALLFLWAEAINTACYTQNRSLICHRYNKTSYELMQDKKSDLSFFHVFGSLCYPTNDLDDLGKFDAKSDIGIFVGYAPAKKAFRIYNKRTRIITETIHVTFNELTTMAYEQFSSGPDFSI